jgi:hypothetical protein
MHQLCKEPDAEKPQVRICGGQASQGACLPDFAMRDDTDDGLQYLSVSK